MPDDLKKKYLDFEKEKVIEMMTETVEEQDENGNSVFVEKPVEINAVNAGALSNKLLQFANGAIYDDKKAFIQFMILSWKLLKRL